MQEQDGGRVGGSGLAVEDGLAVDFDGAMPDAGGVVGRRDGWRGGVGWVSIGEGEVADGGDGGGDQHDGEEGCAAFH